MEVGFPCHGPDYTARRAKEKRKICARAALHGLDCLRRGYLREGEWGAAGGWRAAHASL